jgi:hypothetical protein
MYIFSVNGQTKSLIYIMLNVNVDIYVPLGFDFNKIYSLFQANFARKFIKWKLFILYETVLRNVPGWNPYMKVHLELYNYVSSFLLCIVLWHIDPLLGNDHEISNYIMAVSR